MINPSLVENRIFRGSQPMGEDDWKQLILLGIKNVLDLETGALILEDGDPLNQALAGESFGIRVWSHPMSALMFPSKSKLEDAAKFMSMHKDSGIYVHCRQGVDRTGIVCAKYRMMFDGWSKAKSVAEMRAMGMHPWYWEWEICL